MESIENPMVTEGSREWERMNRPSPSDNATDADYDLFAWETDAVAEMLTQAFGLEDGDLTEEVAKCIYSGLPKDYAMKLLGEWAQGSVVKERYNRYMEEQTWQHS